MIPALLWMLLACGTSPGAHGVQELDCTAVLMPERGRQILETAPERTHTCLVEALHSDQPALTWQGIMFLRHHTELARAYGDRLREIALAPEYERVAHSAVYVLYDLEDIEALEQVALLGGDEAAALEALCVGSKERSDRQRLACQAHGLLRGVCRETPSEPRCARWSE